MFGISISVFFYKTIQSYNYIYIYYFRGNIFFTAIVFSKNANLLTHFFRKHLSTFNSRIFYSYNNFDSNIVKYRLLFLN